MEEIRRDLQLPLMDENLAAFFCLKELLP